MSREKTKTKEPRTFRSELGGGEFYPDLPRINFKEIIDRQVLVMDCQLIQDFKGEYGVHDTLLLKIQLENTQYTTITSGEVLIKRVMKAKAEDMLPLLGTITTGKYYNIL